MMGKVRVGTTIIYDGDIVEQGDATAEDIKAGKSAVVNGRKVIGSASIPTKHQIVDMFYNAGGPEVEAKTMLRVIVEEAVVEPMPRKIVSP